jgi:hypothetical protein
MNANSPRNALAAGALIVLGALTLAGCGKKAGGTLLPNVPPTVELTSAPVSKDQNNPYFYAERVDWSGYDPDGRVDHYEYAIDPPTVVVHDTTKCNNGDTCWVTTKKNEEILFFRASQPDTIVGTKPPTASDPHVFVIRAVDDHGLRSPYKYRAFYAYTIAPTVQILNPTPSSLLGAQVTPSVRIDWTGSDPDGQFSQKPVKYKYIMLDLAAAGNSVFVPDPDSLRRRDAPSNFAGWDSTSADTQFVQKTNLTPGNTYLFALIGYDEAGAYSPVFSLNSNMLRLSPGYASSNGPLIHIYNTYINFMYDSGGYSTDPLREIPIEVPSHRDITVNWDATPPNGSLIQYFRWMVDGNINDQTPRSDEVSDYKHWSQASPTMPNATTLHGFDDGVHRFYLECADNNGQKSLGILRMTAVTPSFDHELLVIDDTRLEVDKFNVDRFGKPTGCPLKYTRPWPSRAEFDTFMFARGNFPWRCASTAANSQPGLFAGYAFDTLGTRLGLENPANGVLLARIGAYKNLIWLVDSDGAIYTEDLNQLVFPVTALYSMSAPGRASTLAAYTQLGGRVWLGGGGAAYASLRHFDKGGNNHGQTTVFQSADPYDELAPSRIMYDGAHWQSTIGITKSGVHAFRYDYTNDVLRRNPIDTTKIDTLHNVPFTVLNQPWSHFDRYTQATLTSPNYSNLPAEMRWRTSATDPLPPTRTLDQNLSFYPSSYPCEYLIEPNFILEDTDPDPGVDHEQVVLDTLMVAESGVLLSSPMPGRGAGNHDAPTMTYYHGSQANRFVFTGFAPWGYSRQDCMQLVDFVLQDLWGLTRQPVDRGSIAPSMRSRGSSPTRIVTPAQRTVSARAPSSTTRE